MARQEQAEVERIYASVPKEEEEVNLEQVRFKVEEWVRWRRPSSNGLGFPRTTQLGAVLDGMPSTDCPTCRGRRRAYGGDCPTCSGSGKIKSDPDVGKINPAFLKSTRITGYQPDNPVCERIDRLVCEMKRLEFEGKMYPARAYYAFMQEFCRQDHRRTQWMQRFNIMQNEFEYLVNQSLTFIGKELKNAI